MSSTLISIYNPELKDGASLHGAVINMVCGLDHSILRIGLALVQIRKEKHFKDLGFRFMSHCIQDLCEKTGKDRSSLYSWLKMGETYIKHEKDLKKAGFGPRDPSKLLYLDRALSIHPKKEVFSNFKKMNQRNFADYARGKTQQDEALRAENPAPQAPDQAQHQRNTIKNISRFEMINQGFISPDWGHTFFYEKKLAAWVNKGLSDRALSMLLPAMRISFNALDRDGYVTAVHLDNWDEFLTFEPYGIWARNLMRKDMRRVVGEGARLLT